MSVSKTIAGLTYVIPSRGEKRWGAQMTALLSTLSDIAAFLTGGTSGTPVFALSATSSSLAAGATLTPATPLHRVQGNGAARTLDATTPIAAGVDGQVLILEGVHASNTITIRDSGTVDLNGDITLGLGSTLQLTYNSSRAKWVELHRNE